MEKLKEELTTFLELIKGKNLDREADYYQEASALFMAGKVEMALEVLDEGKLEAEEKVVRLM